MTSAVNGKELKPFKEMQPLNFGNKWRRNWYERKIGIEKVSRISCSNLFTGLSISKSVRQSFSPLAIYFTYCCNVVTKSIHIPHIA